jgi:glucose-6-phosphate isomerase
MDRHFRDTPAEKNIPTLLALLSVWYNNFWQAESEAIVPYTQYLRNLPAYLQQGIMESNGKGVDRNGKAVDYQTGTIIWGASGTNAQHAFFQLIHQGTKLIPTDFIGFQESLHETGDHQDKLLSNFIAQTEALMCGKTEAVVRKELEEKGLSAQEIDRLTPFKVFTGNRPTTTFLIQKLTPYTLGALIAMYEHKIFVQGIIWNIYSYDQWGVELGKQLANSVLSDLQSDTLAAHDPSTIALIERCKGN